MKRFSTAILFLSVLVSVDAMADTPPSLKDNMSAIGKLVKAIASAVKLNQRHVFPVTPHAIAKGVRSTAWPGLLERILHAPLAEPHHGDERAGADDDAEHGEDGAQLVQPEAAQGQHEAAPTLVPVEHREQKRQQAGEQE